MSATKSTKNMQELSRIEPLHEVVKQDLQEDCMPCRIMGASAFIGLGAFSYFSGHRQLKLQQAKILQSNSFFGMKSRKAGVSGIALTLVGMGLWRLVN